jgi:hypothetical protein
MDMNKISLAIITVLVITTAGLTTTQTAFADRSCTIDPESGTISCSEGGARSGTDTESDEFGRYFTNDDDDDDDTLIDSDGIDRQDTNPFGELVHEIGGKTVCDSEGCEIAGGSGTQRK